MSFQPMQMTETEAPKILSQQDEQGVVAKSVLPIKDFDTFRAELLVEDNDLLFHFFLTDEVLKKGQELASEPPRLALLDTRVRQYWLDVFPRSLDVVARHFFDADRDRLSAGYVEDYGLKSWWLRANGFANVGLSPEARAKAFCEKLDQALDPVKVNLALV